jgi:hypothetical protein
MSPTEASVEAAPDVEEPTTGQSSLDRLDPLPETLALQSGLEVNVLPLKTRQFFKMLRIVTRGGANVLQAMNLSTDVTDEAFAAQLLGIIVFSIPEAEDEAVAFIQAMVEPVRDEDREKFDAEMTNPELEDTVSILEVVMRREGSDLKALGKRLMSMMRTAEKAGVAPKTKKKSRSSEATPASST